MQIFKLYSSLTEHSYAHLFKYLLIRRLVKNIKKSTSVWKGQGQSDN